MKMLLQFFGLLVMMDGLLSAILGHTFLHHLRRLLPRQLHPLLANFERIPQPLFRGGALFQAAAGAHLLWHGSLSMSRKDHESR